MPQLTNDPVMRRVEAELDRFFDVLGRASDLAEQTGLGDELLSFCKSIRGKPNDEVVGALEQWTKDHTYARDKFPGALAVLVPSDIPPRCRWCGDTYEDHLDAPRPDGLVPRMPCVGLKRNFVAKETQ